MIGKKLFIESSVRFSFFFFFGLYLNFAVVELFFHKTGKSISIYKVESLMLREQMTTKKPSQSI
jgi:hypothetical protein